MAHSGAKKNPHIQSPENKRVQNSSNFIWNRPALICSLSPITKARIRKIKNETRTNRLNLTDNDGGPFNFTDIDSVSLTEKEREIRVLSDPNMDSDLSQRMLTYYDKRAPEYEEAYTLDQWRADASSGRLMQSRKAKLGL